MTDWNKPELSSELDDFIQQIKDRDDDLAKMFDGVSSTSIPENSIRFNVSAGTFQRRESGSWVTKTLSNDALSDVNSNTGSFGTNIAIPAITVNAKGRITAVSTNNVRSASTSQSGVVQLNNSTSSTSTTQAATANAVKTAKDAADGAQSSADAASNKATPKTLTGATTNSSDGSGHTHNITGSDAIDENNSNQLATSAAVKASIEESINIGDFRYSRFDLAGGTYIGAYVMAFNTLSGTTTSPGSIVGGSRLRRCSASGTQFPFDSGLPGQWKCMGYSINSEPTLWLRVS